MRERMQKELQIKDSEAAPAIPENVPRALHRFYKNVKG